MSKEFAREKFKIETNLSSKYLRNRLIERNGNNHSIALGLGLHLVIKRQIGINHRVETLHMAARVGKAHRSRDNIAAHLAVYFFGNALPLTGSRF